MNSIRIATWNLQWANPNSDRGKLCKDKLSSLNPDIICLTEAFDTSLNTLDGYSASSQLDYGYPVKRGRRKVVVWSRTPLLETDDIGSIELPSGRFVSGIINEPVALNILGVCIPWKNAHVKTGRKDREAWEDHSRFLSGMQDINAFTQENTPTIVFGDFNQRMSGKYARKDVHEQLKQTFEGYQIATAELTDSDGKSAIDHIAVRNLGNVVQTGVISRFDESGGQLSDHFGVWCDVEVH